MATPIKLTCKNTKCGKVFEIDLATLIEQRNKALCPDCGDKRAYTISEYTKQQA